MSGIIHGNDNVPNDGQSGRPGFSQTVKILFGLLLLSAQRSSPASFRYSKFATCLSSWFRGEQRYEKLQANVRRRLHRNQSSTTAIAASIVRLRLICCMLAPQQAAWCGCQIFVTVRTYVVKMVFLDVGWSHAIY